MTRGGRRRETEGPERRCIATGESGETAPMIRFAVSPEGQVTPDLAEKLPGRGMWVTADRALVERAAAKNLFARAAKRPVRAPEGLADAVEALLARRLIDALAIARKAGLAVAGFEKVKARLTGGPVAALIQARDGAEDGLRKLRPHAHGAPVVDCLDRAELGLAFGREYVVHAALAKGGAADRALREAARLSGFRPGRTDEQADERAHGGAQ